MNGIRKLAFHAARYNRQKYLDSDVRSRPLQSVRRAFFSYRTVVILHRERPCLGSRSGGVFKLSIAVLRRGFFPSPDGSELYLCMPKNFSAYKGTARCCLATTKIRVGESLTEVLKSLRYGLRGRVFPGAILQPCGRCPVLKKVYSD